MFHGTGPHLSVERRRDVTLVVVASSALESHGAEKVFQDIAGRSEVIHLADGIAVRITLSGEA